MGAVLDVIVTQPPWFRLGLCSQADPDAWFPEKGGSAQAAREICAACPVRDLCHQYALARPELEGIWGGHTEHERIKERARQRKATPDGRAPFEGDRGGRTFTGVHGRYGAGGAVMHRRLGEQPCNLCAEAENVYGQEKRARRPRGPRGGRTQEKRAARGARDRLVEQRRQEASAS